MAHLLKFPHIAVEKSTDVKNVEKK